jgi:hypothetical protein
MVESASPSETTLVAVLFPPEALPVIDIFRALGDFEDNYDIGALDALENRLCGLMNRELAKGIVSDALLLAFGLRRERRAPLDYRPVRSRRGTLDEYRLMALMAATYRHDLHLAAAAAASLDILHPQPLVSLAFDIARRLEAAGLQLEAPDPRLFERPEGSMSVEISRPSAPSDRRFNRDF